MEICPLPVIWDAIYRRLLEASRTGDGSNPPPPVPLILAGWAFTNDTEKQERWKATVTWADRHGFQGLIGALSAESMYRVEIATKYAVGPMGGPMYLPWTFDPKPALSSAERQQVLRLLEGHWSDVAGSVASATRPLRLTGRKGRRLLVAARPDAIPLWGTWTTLAKNGRRRHFTRLRASINAVIAPHRIDHVDFAVIDNEAVT